MSASLDEDPRALQEPATRSNSLARRNSYADIVRSTILVGGTSVLTIVIGIVRVKAIALLLGPAGFGLMGLYTSIADLARSLAGMGINSSGVRQIAEAAASGRSESIARTVRALRWTALLLGFAGAASLALLAQPISTWTFGNDNVGSPGTELEFAL